MRQTIRRLLASVLFAGMTFSVHAQVPAPAKPVEKVATPATNARSVAATVNGEAIYEGTVQRALRSVPPGQHNQARKQVLSVLVDNAMIDQYLTRGGVKVDPTDVDKKINEAKAEAAKQKMEFAKLLAQMEVTEAELRHHLTAFLRWEKYLDMQASDKNLRALYAQQTEMFDGSMVRVRHILLSPDMKDAAKVAEAKAALAKTRANLEAVVVAGMAKAPASTDALGREKFRAKLLEDAFAAAAKDQSVCPSKQKGGDVGWFDRAGQMVEPFAKAAFALKPFQMSQVVETEFGFHLILLLDRKPGKDVKFETVKEAVKEVYGDRLREALTAQLQKTAKVEIKSVK